MLERVEGADHWQFRAVHMTENEQDVEHRGEDDTSRTQPSESTKNSHIRDNAHVEPKWPMHHLEQVPEHVIRSEVRRDETIARTRLQLKIGDAMEIRETKKVINPLLQKRSSLLRHSELLSRMCNNGLFLALGHKATSLPHCSHSYHLLRPHLWSQQDL